MKKLLERYQYQKLGSKLVRDLASLSQPYAGTGPKVELLRHLIKELKLERFEYCKEVDGVPYIKVNQYAQARTDAYVRRRGGSNEFSHRQLRAYDMGCFYAS